MTKSRVSIRRRAAEIPVDCLRSDEYDVVQLSENHEAVQSVLSTKMDATICLARALPIGLRGEEHRKTRLGLASVLANGKRRLLPRLSELVGRHFKVLNKKGHHDLLVSACKPFVNECMELLSGLELGPEQLDSLSDIFDPGAGVARRRRLEDTVQKLLGATGQLDDEVGSESVSYALAVAAMGRDSLLGTLAFSLNRHFNRLEGQKMGEIRFSPVPCDTGVPIVWRVGVAPRLNGEIFECRFDELVDSDDNERLKLFGLGPHTCLGKIHTLKIFEELSIFMSTCETIVKSVSVSVSTSKKHVLRIPNMFEIELE